MGTDDLHDVQLVIRLLSHLSNVRVGVSDNAISDEG